MKKLAVGIDLGGTNTAFGLVDENGDIFAESVISTEKYKYFSDYPKYIEALCEAVHALCNSVSFEFELIGIGIGAPNANYHTGQVVTPANLWKFSPDEQDPREERRMFNIAADIAAKFEGVQVAVTNDANAATIGEMVFGSAKGVKDFLMVTLGTGLGSGFVANGEMIYGHDGFAGEFGHVIVERGGRECGCGRKGCLEAYASAIGIKRTAFELMATMNDKSPLRDISFNDLDSAILYQHAVKGDPIAKEAFRLTGMRLGYALASKDCDVTLPDLARLADVFYIGGTKVGALFGEAVVITNPSINRDFRYMIKRQGGMLAKGRLLGIQFETLFEDGLYYELADHALAMSDILREAVKGAGLPLQVDSPTNQLFPIVPDSLLEKIREKYAVTYMNRVDESRSCIRLCTSWATPDEYVDKFIDALKAL